MLLHRWRLLFLLLLGIAASAVADDKLDDSSSTTPTGSLVICGGGSLPESVVTRFVELAGGAEGSLVVIPTASGKVRASDYDATVRRWTERGMGAVSVLHAGDRTEADSSKFVQPLTTATAVWFGGGQQSRLAEIYLETAAEREIVELLGRGGVIGGTSAGAAIQSRVMIQSGNPVPTITTGLDLLPRAIIDQHFLHRNRFNRLLTAVRKHPDRVGVGIDEGTAVIFQRGVCRVLGESYVTVVGTTDGAPPISVQTFRAGQSFRLDSGKK